jgi:hypothetical protein
LGSRRERGQSLPPTIGHRERRTPTSSPWLFTGSMVRKSTRRRKIAWAREMRVGWSLPEIPGRD